MRNFLKLSTLSFLLMLLFSCDPPHNIDFINRTDSEAKIRIKINSKTKNVVFRGTHPEDSIVFNLKPKDTANIYFGIGTWSDSEINEVANSIENIEVESKDIKTMYKSKKSIIEFLKDNRKGFWWHNDIEIEIK
ncbi:hypothetical protein [Flavobacterium sp. 25HG05S-40]|uniref:hypothetical protein n=1 Tax=Flavobacterium sp. 25HG05S-40 TaxID=3458682 RepID=UPI0040443879